MKTKITFKFEAETDGEFCDQSCPSLLPKSTAYSKTCAVFGCCIPLDEQDNGLVTLYKRHPKCIESEEK